MLATGTCVGENYVNRIWVQRGTVKKRQGSVVLFFFFFFCSVIVLRFSVRFTRNVVGGRLNCSRGLIRKLISIDGVPMH